MDKRAWIAIAVVALTGAVTVWALARAQIAAPPPSPEVAEPSSSQRPEDFGHIVRAHRIAAERPDLDRERIAAELSRSDAIVGALHAQGVEDIGDEVHRRINAVRPSDEELLAWFEAHPEHFGDRSFEQSREVLTRLVAIEQVQGELEGLVEGE